VKAALHISLRASVYENSGAAPLKQAAILTLVLLPVLYDWVEHRAAVGSSGKENR